jgi:xylulose-5-phosphate/fructose-6-phosphate phosphoketolase
MTVDYESKEYLKNVDAWWRAANYLSVGQMYLRDNPLLKGGLKADNLKNNPLGHWGTIPGQTFMYAHLNRAINKYDLNMFFISGPGHGGQVMVSGSYLDGSYSELFPDITEDEEGLKKLFKQFSFPGGVASHAAPETPGSIHEGGELGYSLSHGAGAILDNPDVISATMIGDGEAETGPLAGSWFVNSFINPVKDGAVLPILHLNGAKIANPTILGRKSNDDLIDYFSGMGWEPHIVEGDDPEYMHETMAKTLDEVIEKIHAIQEEARQGEAKDAKMPTWPMIVLRTPKGWTGPEEVEGDAVEGSFRSHQVPIPVNANDTEHLDLLESWLQSYRPEELFNDDGTIKQEIKEVAPKGNQRMAMNPIANGGIDPKELALPDWKDLALKIENPGENDGSDMTELGGYVRDIIEKNPDNFLVLGPDEVNSNKLSKAFEVTNRRWMQDINEEYDKWLARDGRIIDGQLSEHQAEGLLEGYVLTGRHGIFASYESFLRIVDSMLTQHFKWMRMSDEVEWRNDYPSLNVIASSYAFQQDHNGYTHQDPGIVTHLAEKKPEYTRAYLPSDANTLMAVMEKALTERQVINLIIASKHERPQWYSAEEAQELVNKGLKVIDWASTVSEDEEPDVVISGAGTEPNLEALAAISILNKEFPEMKIRYVNVVDLFKLRVPEQDPRGISHEEFDKIFTTDKPIIFAYHAFEGLIRDIFFERNNHNLSVHGYREEGDITTPFDMRVRSEMDRFHLAKDAAQQVYGDKADDFATEMDDIIKRHNEYIVENGKDIVDVTDWKWEPLDK